MAPNAEDLLIAWLRRELERRDLPDLLGDDTAQLSLSGRYVVTCDQQVEATHFRDLEAGLIGQRLARVNLSDLAAAGSDPGFATVTIAAPRDFGFKNFFRGLLDACQEFGLTLVGGDLASARRVSVTLTAWGGLPSGRHLLNRASAEPGDSLWLSGLCGESALGRLLLDRGALIHGRGVKLPTRPTLSPSQTRAAKAAVRRHVLPSPLLELGAALSRRKRVAAIDISDGLLLDLDRLTRASEVGAVLDVNQVPLAPQFRQLAEALGEDAVSLALAGGEDYALLFTLPPRGRPPAGFELHRIGSIVEGTGITEAGGGSKNIRLSNRGWDHLWAERR